MITDQTKIYDYILDNVSYIENELKTDSSNVKIDEAKQSTINLIESFRKSRLDKLIEELKDNQEWKDFTIAFYGETNAGKSTIIEALRIYFSENKKVEMQNQFKNILADYEPKNNKLKDLDKKIDKLNENKNNLIVLFQEKENLIKSEIEVKKSEELEKINSSIFYKLLSILNFSSLKKQITKLSSELKNEQNIFEKNLLNLNEDLAKNEPQQKLLKDELIYLENQLLELEDGQIIGDGQSDFTKNISSYKFSQNEQNFNILDVPGIEGNEKIVIDEIEKAVKKAHAVFYVTSSPTPPQKGDENKKGTLEKIKEHLSNQVEIYTIFNKRVTNPIQLNKVVNDGEFESLKVLDEKMEEVLGDNYVGNKYLSARVAFLSLANCLVPQSKNYNEKEKFIEKFSKDDLLEKSFFQEFCNFISTSLVQNTKQKIKKSNFNKANSLLIEFINILSNLLKNNLKPLEDEIIKDTQIVKNNLDDNFKKTKTDIETALKKDLRKFEKDTRDEIYEYIDTNVSDDSFKKGLERVIAENIEILSSNIPISLKNEVEKFQNKIIEILDNFKRRINNSIHDNSNFNMNLSGSSFSLDIDIKSGINKWGLAGSIVGSFGSFGGLAALSGINPIGLAILSILAVATVIIGLFKSLRKVFSDDYKKSEQKKAVDANLKKIITEVEKKLSEKKDEIFKELSLTINTINEDLEVVLNHIQKLNNLIYTTKEKLQIESKKIEIEGEK
jgi:hypothetical protein